MALTQQAILDALHGVVDPNTGKDFVGSKCVRNIVVSGDDVALDLELAYPAQRQAPQLRQLLEGAVRSGVKCASLILASPPNSTSNI
jgi:ATP-binding protein involved in chromosome partitioning